MTDHQPPQPQRKDTPSELSDQQLSQKLVELREAFLHLGPVTAEGVTDLLNGMGASEKQALSTIFTTLSDGSSESLSAAEALSQLAEHGAQRHGRVRISEELAERERAPSNGEPQKIETRDITVFHKMSKIEWDLRKLRQSGASATIDDVLKGYRDQNVDAERILAAHEGHRESLGRIQSVISEDQLFNPDELEEEQVREIIKGSKLVIAAGGDDTMKKIAQYVDDQFFIMMNTDPGSSVGALTHFVSDDTASLVKALREGEFVVQDWARLSAEVNGSPLPCAMSEILIADRNVEKSSRAMVSVGGEEFLMKGSGMLITTGAGSTGWFHSASMHLYPSGNIWPRTERYAEYLQREPYGMDDKQPFELGGKLLPGEKLELTSSFNSEGIVSIDSVSRVSFPRGALAVISLADKPLKVIAPRKSS